MIPRRDIGWALLSGALVTLPFLDFSLSLLAWIAFIPLILALRGKSPRQGAALGLVAGSVFGYAGIYWLARVTFPGYFVLAAYLALYWAAWGAVIAAFISRRPGRLWWGGAAAWVALEFLRAHLFTGFPWNLLGVSQARNLSLVQAASFLGVYGVSGAVILFNTSFAQFIISFRAGRKARFPRYLPPLAAVLILLTLLCYGQGRLRRKETGGETLALTLVQGGIAQELKWDPALAAGHLRTYLDLSRRALPSRPGLIVWPESALPYYLAETSGSPAYRKTQRKMRRELSKLARAGKAYLLVGGDYLTASRPVRYYNSAYLFDPAGEPAGRYDKTHLVPFGEYTPLKRFLPFLRRVVPWDEDFSAGRDLTLLDLGKRGKLGVLICFEDIFPGPARTFARRGADCLVNLTNDAWYGWTIAPYQHAYAARFRAVENRIYLARATNTGYSCVFDPRGRVVGDVSGPGGENLYISDFKTVAIHPSARRSFYTAHGDIFAWSCVFLALLAALGRRKKSRC